MEKMKQYLFQNRNEGKSLQNIFWGCNSIYECIVKKTNILKRNELIRFQLQELALFEVQGN